MASYSSRCQYIMFAIRYIVCSEGKMLASWFRGCGCFSMPPNCRNCVSDGLSSGMNHCADCLSHPCFLLHMLSNGLSSGVTSRSSLRCQATLNIASLVVEYAMRIDVMIVLMMILCVLLSGTTLINRTHHIIIIIFIIIICIIIIIMIIIVMVLWKI